ncbi:MAG: protein-disulfide reductase DsbD [Nevskiales bacterium]
MRRIIFLCLTGLMLFSPASQAGLLDTGENPFLPVDEAFRLQPTEIDGNALKISWQIADGYYLYRHRFEFTVLEPKNLQLAPAELPEGKEKHDEYFGDIQAYYHDVSATLRAVEALPQRIVLSVRYQGCADKGLCYPPQTREVEFTTTATSSAGPSPTAQANSAAIQPEQDRLANFISDRGWLGVIGQFFALGLLLAFTPCVLPMIPILSGIIVGLDQERSTRQAFFLSLAYVLAMASAYAIFGAIAGLFGHNLQAALQAPWVLIAFSALFVALALSMFGLYKLQLPSALQNRVNALSAKQRGGTLLGAAIMGFLAALIVGPCVAPPLAGALLYIGQTGDPIRGGAALFSLGLGMGAPLIVLGTAEGRLLPKTGAWMNRINHLFGFLLLGVAIWLLSRFAPALITMWLWGALIVGLGVYLGALSRAERSGWQQLEQTTGLLALVYGVLILVGAALGGQDPLKPLSHLNSGAQNQVQLTAFKRIKSYEDLQAELAAANGPVMLDFYADWCVACIEYEHKVFPDPQVQGLMQQMTLLQADVTANDATDQALMRKLKVIGPPTMIFYNAGGSEHAASRLIGELKAPAFSEHLKRFLNTGH